MEALVGLGAASSVITIIQALSVGIRIVREHVDGIRKLELEIDGPEGELEAMERGLAIIGNEFKNRSFLREIENWGIVYALTSLLQNAAKTVSRVDVILQDVTHGRRHFTTVRTYYCMKGYEKEINTLKLRMSLYSVSLQMPVILLSRWVTLLRLVKMSLQLIKHAPLYPS